MKMKAVYNLFMFAGLIILVTACFEDPGTKILLDDVSVIEIQEATTATGLDISKTYKRTVDGLNLRDSIRVNLVGPQKSTAVNVSFSIDASSTAVAGTHYNLITTSSVAIPANSSFGFIYYEVIDDNIPTTESYKLKFSLTGADGGATISAKYGAFTRTIRTN